MRKSLLTLSIVFVLCITLINSSRGQNVVISDATFKSYLVGESLINTNSDSEIQLSEATAFTGTIDCDNLGVSDFTGLEAFVNMTNLKIANNNLTSIDLTKNIGLTHLNCSVNQLTSLNVSKNTQLIYLVCSNNMLTSFDARPLINLQTLACQINQISFLDISQCPNLTVLIADNNQLNCLNAANGNNANITTGNFKIASNPSLSCVQVDDVTYSTSTWTNIDLAVNFSLSCNLYIPDANFKAYLVGNTSINTNSDTEIQKDEAQAYSGIINCPSLSIADLTGIEGFSSIYRLSCNNNNLTSIDVSHNKNLDMLQCQSNNLTALDVSQNSLLDYLDCSNNSSLSELNVTQNPNLEFLRSGNTALTELDVTNNILLTTLESYGSQLSELDLTNNSLLSRIVCRNNFLTELNVSHLVFLNSFYCQSNQISSLDLSKNTDLDIFWGNDNLLTNLDIANGNNSNVSDGNFRADNNSGLSCIKVDDISYSTTNWTSIDPTTNFYINVEAGANQTICSGEMVTLAGSGASTYQWEGITDNVTFNPLTFGVEGDTVYYTVEGTDGNACQSKDSVYIVVNPLPSITVTNDGTTITADQTGATYQWLDCNDNDAAITGEQSIDFTATTSGSYSVQIVLNNCVDTSNCESITVVTGLISNSKEKSILIYPNPTSDVIKIINADKASKWLLTNSFGAVVLKGSTSSVDLSTLASGVYYLKTGTYIQKIIKE